MVQRSDDDGVVEAYPLLKLLGLASDNFKLLIAKGYIEQLNEDQVIIIMDWAEHNTIRADRKVDSIHKKLLLSRFPSISLIIAKPRSDVEDNSRRIVGGQSTDAIGKVRLGKEDEVDKSTSPLSEVREVKMGGEFNDVPVIEKKPKDKTAVRIQFKFRELCKKNLNQEPALTVKDYKIAQFALKHLTEDKIYDLFDEWFGLGKPDEELIQMTRALSGNQINSYKVRNNK
jgi:hypothetical protein